MTTPDVLPYDVPSVASSVDHYSDVAYVDNKPVAQPQPQYQQLLLPSMESLAQPSLQQSISQHRLSQPSLPPSIPPLLPPQALPIDQPVYADAPAGQWGFSGLEPFDLFDVSDTLIDNADLSCFFPAPTCNLESSGWVPWQSPDAHLQQRPIASLPTGPAPTESSLPQEYGGCHWTTPRPENRSQPRPFRDVSDHARLLPVWKISVAQYEMIQASLDHLAPVLPRTFTLPSRHSVSRYLEGCIKGVLEHMPILHIPTWSPTSTAPALLLAMLAIGANYKFEDHAALPLFYAAGAAIKHQCGRIKSATLASEPQYEVQWLRLQTMVALIILMVQGSWGPAGQMVMEAIAMQSMLTELARSEGLGPDKYEEEHDDDLTASWQRYIRAESLRRIKTTAYTFVNLQSVAYNVPPCILTSEIQFNMPLSQDEWNAATAQAWNVAREASKITLVPFDTAVQSLFASTEGMPTTAAATPASALANYSLIFAILQRIFFLRESSRAVSPHHSTATRATTLQETDVECLGRALQNWQNRWELSPESSVDPTSIHGPVAFNSTALLRLAWIRLHMDLGPCRNLVSRDPRRIVEAFRSCPALPRWSASLAAALLHAAHALSVPVRIGVSFVAKTQPLGWSVQHSLCNLECAIFLSKWFEAAAAPSQPPVNGPERRLVLLIRSIVTESGLFHDKAFAVADDGRSGAGAPADDDDEASLRLIRHLGTAVAALWASIFAGTHVFALVSTIGESLRMYAEVLEQAHALRTQGGSFWPVGGE